MIAMGVFNLVIEFIITLFLHGLMLICRVILIGVEIVLKWINRLEIQVVRFGIRLHNAVQWPFGLIYFLVLCLKAPFGFLHFIFEFLVKALIKIANLLPKL